jgi:hypothetical protein
MPEHCRFNEPIDPMTGRRQRLGPEQRRALAMLAEAPLGYTRSALLLNGFDAKMVTSLIRRGFATVEPEIAGMGGDRRMSNTHVRITDAGRRALE